jgi:hypothetical protein
MRRFRDLEQIDPARIAQMIKLTRFPSPEGQNDTEFDQETGLVRAADLIGQLGDPHYLRKSNALFREFEGTGVNLRLGFTSPADRGALSDILLDPGGQEDHSCSEARGGHGRGPLTFTRTSSGRSTRKAADLRRRCPSEPGHEFLQPLGSEVWVVSARSPHSTSSLH